MFDRFETTVLLQKYGMNLIPNRIWTPGDGFGQNLDF